MSNKRTAKEILAFYDRQIRKDMDFWIKYRPSQWVDLLPENSFSPLIKSMRTRVGKKFILMLALILSLLFVGVFPTLNFIWSNIFRLWLILLIIPLFYWVFAITSIYTKVLVQAFCRITRVVFYELID